jgi:hypothetical protein
MNGGSAMNNDGGDGDGFDLDDVFGKPSVSFALPSSSQGDSQDSTRTITQRMKRTYEGEDSATTLVEEGGGEEDEDMVATDVEDEGEDQVSSKMTSTFGAGGEKRKIAGSKRAFGRTQSLPASAFQGMDF